MTSLKCKPDSVTLLLQTLQWFSIVFSVNKDYNADCKTMWDKAPASFPGLLGHAGHFLGSGYTVFTSQGYWVTFWLLFPLPTLLFLLPHTLTPLDFKIFFWKPSLTTKPTPELGLLILLFHSILKTTFNYTWLMSFFRLVVCDGQGGLVCCDSWGQKESDTTERLNWTQLNVLLHCRPWTHRRQRLCLSCLL